MTIAAEQDIRVQMLNTFMSCPHRDTDEVKKVHEELQKKDPTFYAHLACWYKKNGDIRDIQEIFTSMLICDPYLDNREVGLALFQNLPAFLKHRVLGFIKGKKVKIRTKLPGTKTINGKKVPNISIEEKTVGLFKNPPTAFKKEVERYLRYIENDNERFDSVAVRHSKDLKALYASLGIKPSSRAQKILFDKDYPKDSKMNIFKVIAEAKPDKAAELIVTNKIPYTSAVGLIDQMTPSIMVALINNMSPQELINNIASLEARGAMDNPDVKSMIEKKLDKAKTSKNVTALKSKEAIKTGKVKDESIINKLDKVADAQIKRKGAIKVPTAILIDRSGSMNEAIEVGKHCAAMVSGATEAPLYVVAFDNAPMEITAKGTSFSDWEKAFQPVRSGGNTSIGCALKYLRHKKYLVDQIIIITDGGENATPAFSSEYPLYSEEMKVKPNVITIRVGNWSEGFVRGLIGAKIENEVYTPDTKDYYGLPGLIQLLSKKSKFDLLMEIMETPLIKRKSYSA